MSRLKCWVELNDPGVSQGTHHGVLLVQASLNALSNDRSLPAVCCSAHIVGPRCVRLRSCRLRTCQVREKKTQLSVGQQSITLGGKLCILGRPHVKDGT